MEAQTDVTKKGDMNDFYKNYMFKTIETGAEDKGNKTVASDITGEAKV